MLNRSIVLQDAAFCINIYIFFFFNFIYSSSESELPGSKLAKISGQNSQKKWNKTTQKSKPRLSLAHRKDQSGF